MAAKKIRVFAPTNRAEMVATAKELGLSWKGGKGGAPILQMVAVCQRKGYRLDLMNYRQEITPTGTAGRKVTFKVDGKGRAVTLSLTVKEIRELTGNTGKRGRISTAAIMAAVAKTHDVDVKSLTDVSVVELDSSGQPVVKAEKPTAQKAAAKPPAAAAEPAKPKARASGAKSKAKPSTDAVDTATPAVTDTVPDTSAESTPDVNTHTPDNASE